MSRPVSRSGAPGQASPAGTPLAAPRGAFSLPRNCSRVRWFRESSGGCLDQRRAEGFRPTGQALHGPSTGLLCICVHAPVHVGGAVLQHRGDQPGAFVGRGGDRFGCPQPGLHAAEERPEGAWTMMQTRCAPAEGRRHALGARLGAPTHHLASGHRLVRTPPPPRRAVRHGRPAAPVQADRPDEEQGGGVVDPLDRGQGTPGDPLQGAAPITRGGVRFRFGLRFGGADGPCWALCSAKVPRGVSLWRSPASICW